MTGALVWIIRQSLNYREKRKTSSSSHNSVFFPLAFCSPLVGGEL